MKRLLVLPLLAGAMLVSPLATAPALAQSCPNQNFAELSVGADPFLASKDHNENGIVCQSREFVMPPPGYPTPFIVIDDLD
jgi:hypothetical protein